MILRPRQKTFVERCHAAIEKHGNTLGVAPTGAGKTIMLSGLVGRLLKDNEAKACVLAHRDELTAQNESKFRKVSPGIS
ncbi:MAG: DEAD/DEAH box helicase family protein, partial [Oricola sp.]|nr:DEAD/DEAH box helicase family protein [Oricola sp.]